jgi:hypothetical protein
MDPTEIRNMLNARPFVPFRIYLSNQHVYSITQPEMIMVTPRTTHIGIIRNAPAESNLYDAVDVVSNVHIVRLEPIIPVAV